MSVSNGKTKPAPNKKTPPVDVEAKAIAHATARISRTSILSELEVGDCESLAQRLTFDQATPANVTSVCRGLASVLRKAASRATSRTKFTYEINYGSYENLRGDKIVVATATRIA